MFSAFILNTLHIPLQLGNTRHPFVDTTLSLGTEVIMKIYSFSALSNGVYLDQALSAHVDTSGNGRLKTAYPLKSAFSSSLSHPVPVSCTVFIVGE